MSGPVERAAHRGQFVLSEDGDRIPAGWVTHHGSGWTLGTLDLPVLQVLDRNGAPIGWCVGHPVLDGVLAGGPVVLETDDRTGVDWPAVEALHRRLAGRFLLVLLPSDEPTVVLDAYGSLAAVHSADRRTVASVPALIGGEPDTRLAEVTGFPHRSTWLPFGLTLTLGTRRLQADHALDLRSWRTTRHWLPPEPGTADGDEVAAVVHDRVRRTIGAVAAVAPLTLSLTGGRDSRLLLACAREVLPEAVFFTLVHPGSETVDTHLATRLAGRYGLEHVLLPVRTTRPEERDEWLTVTGHAVGGELWQAHETLRQLDPGRVLLPGTAGEVGRAHTYRPGDPDNGPVAPETLLRRLRLPALPVYLEHAAGWLAELPDLPYSTVLELAYVEQRLSCWAGPGHYGNRTSRFELSPFASRTLFEAMLSLPLEHRWSERLGDDVLSRAWPELRGLPFNEFTGLRGARDAAARRVKRLVRERVPGLAERR